MRKFLSNFWPFFAILLALVIFFNPYFIDRKVPLPADFIVGVYYPWLDYIWGGYGAGVPVKNPITADVVSFIYPMQTYAIDILKNGHIPLWNPSILTGTPLLANFQTAPFSPTNFFYFFLSKIDAWSLQIITQTLLASVFCFLLLKEFGLKRLSALFGSLAFAYGGFNLIWLEWNGHTLVAAFFPLIILLTLKWIKNPKLLFGILLSLSLTFQIFSGYPQIILYEFLALFLLVLIFDRKLFLNVKKIFLLGFFFSLGIGLAAVQILPGFELLKYSQRSVELAVNEWAFLPWQLIITFLAPDYFGNHATQNYWGPADYTLTTGFSGVVVILAGFLGAVTYFKKKEVKFAAALVTLSLIIAFPTPLSVWLKESGLLGLQAAHAHRSLILSNLGFALLAAFGIEGLLNQHLKLIRIIRASYIPFTLLLCFGVGTLISLILSDQTIDLKVGLRNLVLPVIFFILTLTIFLASLKLKKFSNHLAVLILVLSVFELFRFGWKFTPFSEKELVFPKTPVLEFLQNEKDPFRVAAEDVVPINLMMPYGIETLEGYDAVYSLRFAKYLATLSSGQSGGNPQGRYGSISSYNSNLLDIGNTRFVLALKRDKDGKPDINGKLPDKFNNPKFSVVFDEKSVVVLKNSAALPRAKLFYDWEIGTDERKILDSLSKSDFPKDKKLILEEDPRLSTSSGDIKNMASYEQSANTKLLEVETEKEGVVFIADAWFPGWRAFVNGKQTPIIRANDNFMAIPVGVGKHQILVNYMPTSFEIGKMISLFSSLILLFLVGLTIFKRYGTRS